MISRHPLKYWKSGVIILAPILLLPLPVIVQSPAARCGYVLLLMAVYWMTEAIHLSATALVPVFAFPLLGILSTKEVCLTYMKDTNMLFLGGLAMAAAIEHSGLHQRISLFILKKIGATTERLLLGLMLVVMFLSMWISNTAATAMMVPIVHAVLEKVNEVNNSIRASESGVNNPASDLALTKVDDKSHEETHIESGNQQGKRTTCQQNEAEKSNKEAALSLERNQKFLLILRDITYLGVAYASNIGGTGTLTGTNPNLVLSGLLQLWYPNAETGVNYSTWLLYNVPGMIIATILGYMWLYFLIFYYNGWKRYHNKATDDAVQVLLECKYRDLGPITFHETMVSSLFGLAIALWVFQKPEIFPGWGTFMEHFVGVKISAATPAIFVVFLMFIAPTQPFWKTTSGGPSPGCLTWDVFHHKVPWGVIVLIGSGFALADAGRKSGLSTWIGVQFGVLSGMPKEWSLLAVCVFTVLLTEVMSNTAASSILLPILNDMALAQRVNPIYYLLPVTLCSSYAFMLPVATPPNAIVFEAAKTMTISRMMICGTMMNIVCVVVAYLMSISLGNLMFDFDTFPQWANASLAHI